MELVERYLNAVKRELPTDKQDDIVRELRANILDEIEAAQLDNTPLTTAKISDLLRAKGHPKRIAQSYAPASPLVASDDMPLYKSVLMKAMLLLFGFSILSASTFLVEQQTVNAFAYLFVALGKFVDNIGIVLIVVTVSFYYLGKHGYLSRWRYGDWSPETLPAPNAQGISKSDSITDITTSVFGIMLLWTSLWMNETSHNNLLFSIAPDMEHWRIILSILLTYSLLAAIFRLSQQYWTKRLLAFYIIEYSIYLAVAIVFASHKQLVIFAHTDFIYSERKDFVELLATGHSYIWLGFAIVLGIVTVSLIRKWMNLEKQ
ncbi:hypothetical protein PN836_004570 [Ningiella sp. W23]|uniref:hypothetical protein n=1 Tax=Ningiella sp. W23 TaxID=3023715 RepID=UPI00375630B0